VLQTAKRWLHRDAAKVPAAAQAQLKQARAASPVLDKMVQMREELSQIWLNTSHSREQLAADLQAWCRRAEESGIAALCVTFRSSCVRCAKQPEFPSTANRAFGPCLLLGLLFRSANGYPMRQEKTRQRRVFCRGSGRITSA
jgi:hypothetical protein